MEVLIYSRADVIKAVIAQTNTQNNWTKFFAYVESLMQHTGKLLGAYWIVANEPGDGDSPLYVFCQLLQEECGQPKDATMWQNIIGTLECEELTTSVFKKDIEVAIAKEN